MNALLSCAGLAIVFCFVFYGLGHGVRSVLGCPRDHSTVPVGVEMATMTFLGSFYVYLNKCFLFSEPFAQWHYESLALCSNA